MDNTIEDNALKISDHYNRFFDLFDRDSSLSSAGWNQQPPIVNLGYWAGGATTARQAQIDFVNQLASRLGGLRGSRVLDVGCGLGGPATILACEYGARVDGINIVEQQVLWAQKYIEGNGLQDVLQIQKGNAMDIPFPDEHFDVVLCVEAAHCFVDKTRFLAEARRVLRHGGTFLLADIIATSHIPVLRWQPALKLNLVTVSDWCEMISAAGFEILERTLLGNAVYPGYGKWVDATAAERRRVIFGKICPHQAAAPTRWLKAFQAWAIEFARCRSVLKIGGRLGIREYGVFVARNPVSRV